MALSYTLLLIVTETYNYHNLYTWKKSVKISLSTLRLHIIEKIQQLMPPILQSSNILRQFL